MLPLRRSGASLYSLRLPRGEASWLPPRSARVATAPRRAAPRRRRTAALPRSTAPPSNQYSSARLLVLARGCCEWHARAHCSLRTLVVKPCNHSGTLGCSSSNPRLTAKDPSPVLLLLVLARGCCEWHARAHCSLRTLVINPFNHSGTLGDRRSCYSSNL